MIAKNTMDEQNPPLEMILTGVLRSGRGKGTTSARGRGDGGWGGRKVDGGMGGVMRGEVEGSTGRAGPGEQVKHTNKQSPQTY